MSMHTFNIGEAGDSEIEASNKVLGKIYLNYFYMEFRFSADRWADSWVAS